MNPDAGSYQFGPFQLDPRRHTLLRDGVEVRLTPRAYDLLLTLVTRSGSLVTKRELMTAVWGEIVVEENNLNQAVSALRRALGDAPNSACYIETVPRLGYRFVADVRMNERSEPASAPRATSTWWRTVSPKARLALACALTAAMVLPVVLVLRSGGPQAAARADDVRSIAVLPFLAVDGVDDTYLGVGMADAIITRLGNFADVAVRPTTAVDDLVSPDRDAVAAGKKLGVHTVLDARVQRSNDRLRVTAQLIDVGSRTTLWSGRFDEPLQEVFALQDAIAGRLVDTLAPRLTAQLQARRQNRPRLPNAAAYDQYIKGRFFWNRRSRDGFQQALQAFQRALEEDPAYADAYAGLADCYNLMPEYGLMPALEAMPRARTAAHRALQIDPDLAEAHASLAYTLANFDFDFEEADRSFRRALDLNPSYATGHQWYAEYLGAMGRPEESWAAYQRALALDPLSPIINALAEYSYAGLGQYERAAKGLQRVIAEYPDFRIAHNYLADLYTRQGRFAEALGEVERYYQLTGDDAVRIARLRRAYAAAGVTAVWREELTLELQQAHPSPFNIARLYAMLGDRDQAMIWLEKAYEKRDRFLIFIRSQQAFARLATDPRFQQLLERIGF